jgi:hypothetical protein
MLFSQEDHSTLFCNAQPLSRTKSWSARHISKKTPH